MPGSDIRMQPRHHSLHTRNPIAPLACCRRFLGFVCDASWLQVFVG
jgi:hypothetical protein